LVENSVAWTDVVSVASKERLLALNLAAWTVSHWVEKKDNDSVDWKEAQKVGYLEH
jgi:hypothetical protein